MCKYVLIALIVILVVLMVVAAVVVQEYGWTGFLIMLGVLVVLAYIAKKLSPRLFRYMIMRPMRQMGAALRGARIVVHSVTPTEAPSGEDLEDLYDPNAVSDDYDDEDEDPEERFAQRNLPRYDWYFIEFTLYPPGPDSSEGVTRHRQGWMPDMVSARFVGEGKRVDDLFAGLNEDNPTLDFDLIQHGGIEIWDGEAFGPCGETVFGEQRLRLRVGVAPRATEATIVYTQFTELGRVQFPRLNIAPESTP